MSNISIAEAYYTAIREKNKDSVSKYLHSDIHFKGPMAEAGGKEPVLKIIQNFSNAILDLNIRAKFESGNQAMLAYDVSFPEPVGMVRGAVLMTFQEGLISTIELFYDSKIAEQRKDEIFKND
jgi:hypothetical protein